ncbi:MAG: hypothetical protein GX442_21690 [Candidatus Riflebacteria bacterium]|nr:hypothetical protein [Candidatus Riflebacteria bacterium]
MALHRYDIAACEGFLIPDVFRSLLSQAATVTWYAWVLGGGKDAKDLFAGYDGSNVGGGVIWGVASASRRESSSRLFYQGLGALGDRLPEETRDAMSLILEEDFPDGYVVLNAILYPRQERRSPLPPRPEHLEPFLVALRLTDPKAGPEIASNLKPEDFHDSRLRHAYERLSREGPGAVPRPRGVIHKAGEKAEDQDFLKALRSLAPPSVSPHILKRAIRDLKACHRIPAGKNRVK